MIKEFLISTDGFETRKQLWINRLIVILAFIFPFSEIYGKNIVTIMMVLWIFSLNKEKLLRVFKYPVVKYFGLLTLLMLVSTLYTTDYELNFKLFNRMWLYMLIPMIIIAYSARRDYILFSISAFILSMFINEVISYGILFGWWLNLKHGYPVYFMPHVFYGVLVSFVLMLMIYQITHIKSKFYKIIVFAFILTMIGNLVVSGARTGQVILIITFVLTSIIFYKIRFKALLAVILAPVVFIFIAYTTYPQFKDRVHYMIHDVEKIIDNKNYNTSFGTRISAYVLTYSMIHENSLFQNILGHGAGDLHEAKAQIAIKHHPKQMVTQERYSQFHSTYMDIFGWLGLIGIILLALFLYSILKIGVKDDFMRYIKISLFFVLIIAYLPDSGLDSQYIMLMSALFIGLLLAQSRHEESETRILEEEG